MLRWLPVCCLLLIALPAQGAVPIATQGVVINELMPDPSGSDTGNEWIELFNPAPTAVDIDGWYLGDDGTRTHTLAGELAPYEFLRVDLGTAFARLQLSNGGEPVRLHLPDGSVVDEVTYSRAPDVDAGEVPAPGEGESLARYYILGPGGLAIDDATDWYIDDEPSPGGPNNRYALD